MTSPGHLTQCVFFAAVPESGNTPQPEALSEAPGSESSSKARLSARRHSTRSKKAKENERASMFLTTPNVMPQGRLEMIVGPMFSGKTTELMKRIEVNERSGRMVLAVKSDIDTRYAKTEGHRSVIVSHSGGRKECISVSKLSSLEKLFPNEYQKAEVIAIDEAQFFTDLVKFCEKAVDEDHKIVYVAGLDGDFRRKPFQLDSKDGSQMMQIVPLADDISKHLAQCHYCKATAPFTLRTISDKREVVVGGMDVYVPACRYHYKLKWKEFQLDDSTEDIE